MAIITNKDAGVFDIVEKAYVRIGNIQLLINEKKVNFEIKTYISKRAREIEIIQEYCRNKSFLIQRHFEPEEGQLEELELTKEEWDEYIINGPWDFEELQWLDKNIFCFVGDCLQTITITMGYDDFTDEVNEENLKKYLYKKFYNDQGMKQFIKTSADIFADKELILDDFETKEEVINKWLEKYPILNKE